jgi:hypothetical protein
MTLQSKSLSLAMKMTLVAGEVVWTPHSDGWLVNAVGTLSLKHPTHMHLQAVQLHHAMTNHVGQSHLQLQMTGVPSTVMVWFRIAHQHFASVTE